MHGLLSPFMQLYSTTPLQTMVYYQEHDFPPPTAEYPISSSGAFHPSVDLPAEGMWMSMDSHACINSRSNVPLHAPIPIPSQLPCILEDCTITGYHTLLPSQETPSETSYSQEPTQSIPRTFPTPSEMLVQLAAVDTPSTERRAESGRLARRRAMAANLGFLPTDPDSISSHEKKRHYLECLERYVLYLQQQIELLGAKPFPIQRVNSYQGLDNRSIRTLLVHMQATSRKLHLQTLDEEERFVQLRDSVCRQGLASNHDNSQRGQYHIAN